MPQSSLRDFHPLPRNSFPHWESHQKQRTIPVEYDGNNVEEFIDAMFKIDKDGALLHTMKCNLLNFPKRRWY